MQRPIYVAHGVAIGLALFSGACAAPAANPQASTNADSTAPLLNAAPQSTPQRSAADQFNGASALNPTGVGQAANRTRDPSATPSRAAPSRAGTPAAVAQGPQTPAGANFSIFCDEYTGADHVAVSTEMKRVLTQNSKLKDWYVVHEETRSVLYLGYYRQFDVKSLPADAPKADRDDVARAQRDKAMLETIPDPRATERKLFPRAIFVGLNSPDPDAPAEWNLANAKGFWSVQVAAFNTPDRKQAAVDAVREARKMGVEAYYFHGKDGISQVCVGTWPEKAVKMPAYMADPGKQGVDQGADPERGLFVDYGSTPLDPASVQRLKNSGSGVRVIASKAEIVDQTMQAVLNKYPVHAVNGEEQIPTDTGIPRPSFIVYIPGHEPKDMTGGGNDPNGAPSAAEAAQNRANLQNRLQRIGQ